MIPSLKYLDKIDADGKERLDSDDEEEDEEEDEEADEEEIDEEEVEEEEEEDGEGSDGEGEEDEVRSSFLFYLTIFSCILILLRICLV